MQTPELRGREWGRPMRREHAWNLKVRCQRSQWRGRIFSERRCYAGVEYQMFKSLSGSLTITQFTFFFFFLKKEYREKKKVLPSFEEKAKHLCTKTKWIVNRCTAHLWSNKFFSIHWQTIQNRRRRHCSRADITIQFTQLWKSQIPTMTRDSQKVIVYTWSIMGK